MLQVWIVHVVEKQLHGFMTYDNDTNQDLFDLSVTFCGVLDLSIPDSVDLWLLFLTENSRHD